MAMIQRTTAATIGDCRFQVEASRKHSPAILILYVGDIDELVHVSAHDLRMIAEFFSDAAELVEYMHGQAGIAG